MKWRKLNRAIHRDLGYIFFGMTIIYSVSGIVLNHRKHGGDASIVTREAEFTYSPAEKSGINRDFISGIMQELNIPDSEYKNYYFKSENHLMVYLKNGHISYFTDSGTGELTQIRKRKILYDFNFLHYNKPKKLWTWFSDIFAVSLGLMAISGLFILKGKNGIKSRGAILVGIGIMIPAIFLSIYLWSI